jgi:hypothetical protein
MEESMFKTTLKIVGFVFVVLCCISHSSAQSRASAFDCSRADKSRPPLFITYEGSEQKNVLLRLHNNSRCAVLIPTNQLQGSLKVVRQGDGRLKFETMEELKDGARIPVVYNLFNRQGSKDTVIVSDGCVVMTRSLLPQQSILLAIPVADFKRNADVGVEFNYPWEEDDGSAVGGAFGHYVFFRNENLPKAAMR